MRRCYNCKSPDHVVADCPYNSDNDEDEKKKAQEGQERKEGEEGEKDDLPKEEGWRLYGHLG